MADIFKVIGTGRLTRDMEIKYTTGGMAIGNFAIAVNRRTKKGDAWQDEASFFDCKLFGKSAEGINQYMTKGKQVAIDGTLTQERWEKDGQNHSKTVIICDTVQLLGAKDGNSQQNASSGAPRSPESVPDQDFDDDIPF
jgi:single-strand DNA-binding protein